MTKGRTGGRAQREPDEYQQGSYVTNTQGKTRNVGKAYKPKKLVEVGPSRTQTQKTPIEKPPPVDVRHHGDQNDLGIDPDFLMQLDPTLPTAEEVRGSYGNVFNFLCCFVHLAHWGIEPKWLYAAMAPQEIILPGEYSPYRRKRVQDLHSLPKIGPLALFVLPWPANVLSGLLPDITWQANLPPITEMDWPVLPRCRFMGGWCATMRRPYGRNLSLSGNTARSMQFIGGHQRSGRRSNDPAEQFCPGLAASVRWSQIRWKWLWRSRVCWWRPWWSRMGWCYRLANRPTKDSNPHSRWVGQRTSPLGRCFRFDFSPDYLVRMWSSRALTRRRFARFAVISCKLH